MVSSSRTALVPLFALGIMLLLGGSIVPAASAARGSARKALGGFYPSSETAPQPASSTCLVPVEVTLIKKNAATVQLSIGENLKRTTPFGPSLLNGFSIFNNLYTKLESCKDYKGQVGLSETEVDLVPYMLCWRMVGITPLILFSVMMDILGGFEAHTLVHKISYISLTHD